MQRNGVGRLPPLPHLDMQEALWYYRPARDPIGAARTLLWFRWCFGDGIIFVTAVVVVMVVVESLTVSPQFLMLMLMARTKRLFLFRNVLVLFCGLTSMNFYFCRPFYAWLMSRWLFHEYNSPPLRYGCLIMEARNVYMSVLSRRDLRWIIRSD